MTSPARALRDPSLALPDLTISFVVGRVLDSASTSLLRARVQQATVAPSRVLMDCTAVQTVEPVGAVLLWRLALELEHSFGATLCLTHLSLPLINRLRGHPLRRYISAGEELFQDPFSSPQPSDR